MIPPAIAADRPALRRAIVASRRSARTGGHRKRLQEAERRHHDTRLPGKQVADDYLEWMCRRSAADGTILVAEIDGAFAGFVAGWIEQAPNTAETPDANRFGLVSDIFVAPEFRGRRLAARLIGAMEQAVRSAGVVPVRVSTLAANESARRSYQHAGFVPYEIVHAKRIGENGHE